MSMSLEQVRDGLRTMKTHPHSLFSKWADAIDAYLNAAKGEAVSQEPSNDREALVYLMDRFDTEEWECRCGHAESTKDMDSAIFLREYLHTHPVSPDVVRDAERYRIVRNYYGVDLDDSDRRVYHDALDRQLDKDINEFGAKAMAAREDGE